MSGKSDTKSLSKAQLTSLYETLTKNGKSGKKGKGAASPVKKVQVKVPAKAPLPQSPLTKSATPQVKKPAPKKEGARKPLNLEEHGVSDYNEDRPIKFPTLFNAPPVPLDRQIAMDSNSFLQILAHKAETDMKRESVYTGSQNLVDHFNRNRLKRPPNLTDTTDHYIPKSYVIMNAVSDLYQPGDVQAMSFEQPVSRDEFSTNYPDCTFGSVQTTTVDVQLSDLMDRQQLIKTTPEDDPPEVKEAAIEQEPTFRTLFDPVIAYDTVIDFKLSPASAPVQGKVPFLEVTSVAYHMMALPQFTFYPNTECFGVLFDDSLPNPPIKYSYKKSVVDDKGEFTTLPMWEAEIDPEAQRTIYSADWEVKHYLTWKHYSCGIPNEWTELAEVLEKGQLLPKKDPENPMEPDEYFGRVIPPELNIDESHSWDGTTKQEQEAILERSKDYEYYRKRIAYGPDGWIDDSFLDMGTWQWQSNWLLQFDQVIEKDTRKQGGWEVPGKARFEGGDVDPAVQNHTSFIVEGTIPKGPEDPTRFGTPHEPAENFVWGYADMNITNQNYYNVGQNNQDWAGKIQSYNKADVALNKAIGNNSSSVLNMGIGDLFEDYAGVAGADDPDLPKDEFLETKTYVDIPDGDNYQQVMEVGNDVAETMLNVQANKCNVTHPDTPEYINSLVQEADNPNVTTRDFTAGNATMGKFGPLGELYMTDLFHFNIPLKKTTDDGELFKEHPNFTQYKWWYYLAEWSQVPEYSATFSYRVVWCTPETFENIFGFGFYDNGPTVKTSLSLDVYYGMTPYGGTPSPDNFLDARKKQDHQPFRHHYGYRKKVVLDATSINPHNHKSPYSFTDEMNSRRIKHRPTERHPVFSRHTHTIMCTLKEMMRYKHKPVKNTRSPHHMVFNAIKYSSANRNPHLMKFREVLFDSYPKRIARVGPGSKGYKIKQSTTRLEAARSRARIRSLQGRRESVDSNRTELLAHEDDEQDSDQDQDMLIAPVSTRNLRQRT